MFLNAYVKMPNNTGELKIIDLYINGTFINSSSYSQPPRINEAKSYLCGRPDPNNDEVVNGANVDITEFYLFLEHSAVSVNPASTRKSSSFSRPNEYIS